MREDERAEGPGRLSRRQVHRGRRIDVGMDTVRFPDGSTGELDMILHPGASAILPVVGEASEADPEILLIHQYRYAAGGWIWEVPAGIPDRTGEPWEECAARELEEETGMRAGTLRYLTRIYTTPGFTDEVIHLFLAERLEEGAVQLDDDEFVEVVRIPFSQALEWVREGRIVDAKSVSTLLYAASFVIGVGSAGTAAPRSDGG